MRRFPTAARPSSPGSVPDEPWHGVGTMSARARHQRAGVLLIGDDPVVRDSVQALLEYFGYECGIAADGPSGLKRFEGETWDLVITDLTLPGMTGWQVIDAIRGRVPGVPVIVITGVDDPSVRTRARQCQVSLLLKPFGLDVLKAALVDASHEPEHEEHGHDHREQDAPQPREDGEHAGHHGSSTRARDFIVSSCRRKNRRTAASWR